MSLRLLPRPALAACAQAAFFVLTALVLTARAMGAEEAALPAPPAGAYTLDRSHASLIFRVSHLGFSRYTARFTRFDAALQFDPEDPQAMSVTATVDPRSLETDFPDPSYDFDAVLQGPDWLDAERFPEMAFRSTAIEPTGPQSARVEGEFTLHGVTRPVTLQATFNGGYGGHPLDPAGSRIGFSAEGSLRRSEFGIAYGVPPAGSSFGVGDEVEFVIEVEFVRPAEKPARPQQQ